jgi:hypothetical protein
LNITTKNIFYWIAHYVFEDTDGITESVVKKRIMELATELKWKSENLKEEKKEENSKSENPNQLKVNLMQNSVIMTN